MTESQHADHTTRRNRKSDDDSYDPSSERAPPSDYSQDSATYRDRRTTPYANIPTNFTFAPRAWSDVVAIASLVAMVVGMIAWGLKLEARIDAVNVEATRVAAQVSKGILPTTEERMNILSQRLTDLARLIDKLDDKIEKECSVYSPPPASTPNRRNSVDPVPLNPLNPLNLKNNNSHTAATDSLIINHSEKSIDFP